MAKPSFTLEEQVSHLSKKWHLEQDRVRQMLRDVRGMFSDSLLRGERLYLDDLGTLHVKVRRPTRKRLPGQASSTLIPARLTVVFEESRDLLQDLTSAFKDDLDEANHP